MREDNTTSYVSNPEAETEMLIQAFLDEIARHFADSVKGQTFVELIRSRCSELFTAHQGWIVDEAARYNLMMTAAMLAAYQVLQGALPNDELLPLLHDAFINPMRGYVQSASAQMLDNAADPFKGMVETSKVREVDAFGAGFTFERERDDDRAYLVNVKRCFYHNFFAANGAAELTPIFCDFDANWITAINPVRHGFRFARPTTIGYGGIMCPFHFYRIERKQPE
jgi:hypothetical protein